MCLMLNKLKSKIGEIQEQKTWYLFLEWWFYKQSGTLSALWVFYFIGMIGWREEVGGADGKVVCLSVNVSPVLCYLCITHSSFYTHTVQITGAVTLWGGCEKNSQDRELHVVGFPEEWEQVDFIWDHCLAELSSPCPWSLSFLDALQSL